jgi:hypothetical protein
MVWNGYHQKSLLAFSEKERDIMGMGGVPAGGFVKVVLAMMVIVMVLAFMAAIGMTDTVAQLTTSQVEVMEREAVVNQEIDQWNIERPHFQELMEADYIAALAQANQDRLLIEAETAAELASIQAAAENFQAALIEQRQMTLADFEQTRIAGERWNRVSTTLVAVFGVVTILTLAILVIMIAYRVFDTRPAVAAVGVPTNGIWRDPIERRKRIDILRKIDERERERMLRRTTRPGYTNGRTQPRPFPPSMN